MKRNPDLPLVYSCSGCSSAAQLANHVAVRMDRAGYAEMSCIAGVGGDVPSLVRVAKSGRPIIAIDGCVLACVRNSLARHGVVPAVHHELSKLGIRKRYGTDYDPADADRVFGQITRELSSEPVSPARVPEMLEQGGHEQSVERSWPGLEGMGSSTGMGMC
ncbi:MAG: putative zinc-binding protein [Gemmatimonadales bacterium]